MRAASRERSCSPWEGAAHSETDPLTGASLFAPVRASDGRVYNVCTLFEMLSGDGLLCPFTRLSLSTSVERLDGSKIDLLALRDEIRSIREGSLGLEHASWAARSIRGAVLAAVRRRGEDVRFAAPVYLDDLEIVSAAALHAPEVVGHIGPEISQSHSALIELFQASPGAFAHASAKLRDDRAFVLDLLRRVPAAFAHVSERLRTDRTVAARALSRAGGEVRDLPEHAPDRRGLVGLAVRRAARQLSDAPDLRGDPALAALALAVGGRFALEALEPKLAERLAPFTLYGGIDVDRVSEAWPDLGRETAALLLAAARPGWVGVRPEGRPSDLPGPLAEALTHGRAEAWVACLKDGRRFAALAPELRGEAEIALAALLHPSPGELADAPESLRDTPALVEAALDHAASAFVSASERVRAMPDVAEAAVRADPRNLSAVAFEAIPDAAARDRLVDAALEAGPEAIASVPAALLTPERALKALQRRGELLDQIPKEMLSPKLVTAALAQNPLALACLPADLRAPHVTSAVTRDGRALAFVPEVLVTPELCETAVRSNPRAWAHVPPAFATPELRRIALGALVAIGLEAGESIDVAAEKAEAELDSGRQHAIHLGGPSPPARALYSLGSLLGESSTSRDP